MPSKQKKFPCFWCYSIPTGSWLLIRVISITIYVTLVASLTVRLGSIHIDAFQICLQIWLTSSLLAEGLTMAGQAFAEKGYDRATAAATRMLQVRSRK